MIIQENGKKRITTRIIHKHDTEQNWNKATSFIPKQGELIIYDKDTTHSYERFKIGDGTTTVVNLPFTLDIILADAKAYVDEAILNGEW